MPIFKKTGEVLFALTAVGYIERISQVFDEILERLRAAAREIEAVL